MRTLVLDKSALEAAPQGFLGSIRGEFTFLLIETLLHEVGTQGIERRETLSAPEREALDRKIQANFTKAINECGNQWLDNETALTYEISRGHSAKHAPRFPLPGVPSVDMDSPETRQSCIDFDAQMGKTLAIDRYPVDQQSLDRTRSLGEEALFNEIRAEWSSPQGRRRCSHLAKMGFRKMANAKGLQVSPRFDPGPGWLTFGIELMGRALFTVRSWIERDAGVVHRRSPNPFFDSIYVAYISIANGILSSDKGLLTLAWACWAEKEKNIYEFNMHTHEMQPFVPQWSS